MFGDVLKRNILKLNCASKNKFSNDSFWIILRNIAVEEIKAISPDKVDSDTAVPIYYKILELNIDVLPPYFVQKLESNKQYRFRVINRNLWTSNAFHQDGLANQVGIKAKKIINIDKKGSKIVYNWEDN